TVAERLLGFVLAKLPGALQLRLVGHRPHAAAAATGNRLDHDAIGRFVEERDGLGETRSLRRTLQHRHRASLGQGAGCCLVAEQIERLRRRADEDKAGRFAGPGKRRVLAQEAITWMNGVASALLRCRDDLQDIEIGRGAYTLKRPALIAAS